MPSGLESKDEYNNNKNKTMTSHTYPKNSTDVFLIVRIGYLRLYLQDNISFETHYRPLGGQIGNFGCGKPHFAP
jgi:hypothetical protein